MGTELQEGRKRQSMTIDEWRVWEEEWLAWVRECEAKGKKNRGEFTFTEVPSSKDT